MAYVDYEYYKNTYVRGLTPKIDSASSFNFLEKKAENYLNFKTGGAYLSVTDETSIGKIKDCLCALIESFNDEESLKQNGVFKQSESVGGHSVSYASPLLVRSQYEGNRLEIITMYLWDLGITQSRKVYVYES